MLINWIQFKMLSAAHVYRQTSGGWCCCFFSLKRSLVDLFTKLLRETDWILRNNNIIILSQPRIYQPNPFQNSNVKFSNYRFLRRNIFKLGKKTKQNFFHLIGSCRHLTPILGLYLILWVFTFCFCLPTKSHFFPLIPQIIDFNRKHSHHNYDSKNFLESPKWENNYTSIYKYIL